MPKLSMRQSMWETYTVKSTGPSTDPRGTPAFDEQMLDDDCPIQTKKLRDRRYDAIQSLAGPITLERRPTRRQCARGYRQRFSPEQSR